MKSVTHCSLTIGSANILGLTSFLFLPAPMQLLQGGYHLGFFAPAGGSIPMMPQAIGSIY